MFDRLFEIVLFLPLFTGILIGLSIWFGFNRGESGEKPTGTITLINAAVVLLILAWAALKGFKDQWPGYIEIYRWFESGDLNITLAILIDLFSITTAALFCLLLFLTMRFSTLYMHREAGFQRFFMLLNLFLSAVLFITLSGNALTAFVGWELAGLCSYLLIAYAYDRPIPGRQATRVFITNRIGDAGFILSLILSYLWLGDTDWAGFTEKAVTLSPVKSSMILSGFVLAAIVKSAQIPFTSWITRALEGPTPSSAIFYGALLIHAGVFLLLRLHGAAEPLVGIQMVLLMTGSLTLLYGWLGGMVQTDIKTALIFSTIAHVAVMFISISMGWYLFAFIHMLAHAVWRSYQMLSAPSFNHLVSRPSRIVPPWLRNRKLILTAALQRFWLDNISDWLVVRPVESLSLELKQFDERVINKIVGLPAQINAITSLSDYEERKRGHAPSGAILPQGRGILGAAMERLAIILHWFEDQLVLKGSGEGLVNVLLKTGRYLHRIDGLLSQPRYLWLIIVVTLIVVIQYSN